MVGKVTRHQRAQTLNREMWLTEHLPMSGQLEAGENVSPPLRERALRRSDSPTLALDRMDRLDVRLRLGIEAKQSSPRHAQQ
jgi:hypothetical protein